MRTLLTLTLSMRNLLFLLVSGAGFALAGCGGDGSPAATPTTPAPAAPPADLKPAFPSGGDSVPDQVFIEGVEIAPLTLPAATGGDGTLSYELTPALPGGLSLDPDTRVISGDPNGVSEGQAYSWTATDADGDAAVIQFSITVEEDVAPRWRSTERIPDQVWVLDDPIAPLTLPEAVGGNGEISYRVQPPLPDGVRLNGRVLSGTPTGTEHWGGTKRRYAWVATDSNGDPASEVFNLGLEGGVLRADIPRRYHDYHCDESSCEGTIWFDRWRLLDVKVESYGVHGITTIQDALDLLHDNERFNELISREQPLLYREWREIADEVWGPRLIFESRESRDNLDAGEPWTLSFPRNTEFISWTRWDWREEIFVGGEPAAGEANFSDMMWEAGGPEKIVVSPDTRRHN